MSAEFERLERLRRALQKDRWRSENAKKFNCELCANGECKKCVRPCFCQHGR